MGFMHGSVSLAVAVDEGGGMHYSASMDRQRRRSLLLFF